MCGSDVVSAGRQPEQPILAAIVGQDRLHDRQRDTCGGVMATSTPRAGLAKRMVREWQMERHKQTGMVPRKKGTYRQERLQRRCPLVNEERGLGYSHFT
jgi:hypothetical protein